MTSLPPESAAPVRRSVNPWLVLICLLPVLFAIQNALIVRAAIGALAAFGASATEFWIYLALGLMQLAIAVLLIANVRKGYAITALVICLAYCGVVAPHLYGLIGVAQGGPAYSTPVGRLLSTTSLLSIAAIVYLLRSKRIEAVYGTDFRSR
ncbi:hypothetical protein [Sphingomonas colocasiae]|uniref:DoxX family protein n=1 Tax=Sphingomonas colocasiae TaxID=1848973 RepID=A0ABS7PUH0_9SPHN|nr:hypothetical protein [Sphingomonas colocasiae]MBY8825012.1 hypothetical protein [Sphingomonas colocasiae]